MKTDLRYFTIFGIKDLVYMYRRCPYLPIKNGLNQDYTYKHQLYRFLTNSFYILGRNFCFCQWPSTGYSLPMDENASFTS